MAVRVHRNAFCETEQEIAWRQALQNVCIGKDSRATYQEISQYDYLDNNFIKKIRLQQYCINTRAMPECVITISVLSPYVELSLYDASHLFSLYLKLEP